MPAKFQVREHWHQVMRAFNYTLQTVVLLHVQAGRIGSTAVMQLTEHDMTIYSAAHPQTDVSGRRGNVALQAT